MHVDFWSNHQFLYSQIIMSILKKKSLFYEILAGVWVRNGLQIKGQAMTYIQANFCNSMVDMDIYWLQVCAAHLPPDQFMDMCIDMFGVREWLSMLPMSPVQAAEQDAMVEGLLTFLAILVSSRTNLGNDELTQSRLEVSTLLAAGDKTHSQLLELMPERSGNAHTRNFETVLKELSTYRPPPKGSENLEQGLFVPKPIVWEQYYDPLHVLRRAVHRRDFHASMERYTAYVCLYDAACARSRRTVARAGAAAEKNDSKGDTEWEPSEPDTTRLPSITNSSTITALSLPMPMQVVRGDSIQDDQSDAGGDGRPMRALESGMGESQALVLQSIDVDTEMTLALRDMPPVPIEYDDMSMLEGAEWSVSLRAQSPRRAPALPAPPHSLPPDQPSTSNQIATVQMHSQTEPDSIPVNESIISLLLKLHSQLSGRLDSFSLEEPAPPNEEVIGEGAAASTSVLGHRRRADSGGARLALSENERARLHAQADTTAAAHHYRLHDDLHQHFDKESWLLSVNVGWEGGVHVQSCGHHLHLRCLAAYLRALQAPQRPHNLHVDRGEFLCPLCRQLANTVLPLAPRPRPARPPPAPSTPDHQNHHDQRAAAIQEMLDTLHPEPEQSNLSEAMGKSMEDMTATAGGKLKQRYGSSPAGIFTFVASLVRTNLECELVQRGGTLQTTAAPRYKPRNDCIVPLLVVAGAHSRVLRAAGAKLGASEAWRLLAPVPAAALGSSATPLVPAPPASARPVPLLLRDPLALLMHFLLLAPPDPPYLDMQDFTCIVRQLYALCYYQIVCQFLANTSAEGRAALAGAGREAEPAGLRHAARLLLGALAGSELFTEDGPPDHTADHHQPDILQMERELQELLLPFVRIAALVRHHLYGCELPEVATPRQEFVRLCYYLELLVVRRLLRALHVAWAAPRLLALPREYDRVFTYYHERVCLQCGAVPKEASVCLLCGTLVCLKQPCCRRHQVAEAVQHAMECGGGTGIFLVVTSTYIIVIRGRRACLWGSLYLDDYDEEDRDLKRGKPLYLSQDRLELLQAQWLAHRFDHTKRTWVWHRDSL
ncbi:hypothetical protein O3G_MSEX005907 [Manduca sexta]|uniref:E3 ubiquitin-protein ligase n=1 Tax=Manduca sexta TaxID=7130 RepID=A0A921Z0B9_MANSE|nr:hypothetical protein O3G_MSEX005907 [Manduca sexta]